MRIMRSNHGAALLMALLGIIILAGLAILMVKRGTFGMRDTVNFKNVQAAFVAAEAGLEHGRKLLNDGASDTWDDELTAQAATDGLTNTADDVNFIQTATGQFAPANIGAGRTYVVRIEDNVDMDPSPLVDADNHIWLISTGTSGTKSTTIRVLVENDAQDLHISQEHYGERSLGQAQAEGRNVTGTTRGTL